MGALDLGGASTQITFVSGQSVESPDNSMDFRLYGNDYQLYTHSFLCYGKDQVLKLALEKRLMVRQHSTEEERLDLKEIHWHWVYGLFSVLFSLNLDLILYF